MVSEPHAAAIWIRVSTDEQARGESPEHHEHRARSYAEFKGWPVVRAYNLSGWSGKTVWDHPEAQAMREDVASGRVQVLIFSKLARLARNTRELLDFADFFRDQGADMVSLQESIDTSSPAGRLFYTMVAASAQWEREEIASRVEASVKVRASLGKSLGGAAPYGYRWEEKVLVLDEAEAAIRKLMYELFVEIGRVKTVADELNKRGHRTRRGANFSGATVRRLLQDPVAKGERRINYTRSLGQNQKWEIKPEEEWETVAVPAIITPETFDAVQRRLHGIGANRKKRSKRATYLFSGLVYCTCGTKMYKPSNMKKYYCRGCLNKLPEHDLELIFSEQLKRFFLNPEEIEAQLMRGSEEIEAAQARLETMVAERTRLKREMDQIFQLYLDGGLTSAGFSDRNAPYEARREQLEEEIPRLQGELDAKRLSQQSARVVVEESQTLYTHWGELTHEEKRAVIETVVERITVGGDVVDIALAYVPASPHRAHEPQQAVFAHPNGEREVVDKSEHMGTGSSTPPA